LQSQITQTSATTTGQGVDERNMSLPYVGELANDYYAYPLPVDEKEKLGTTKEVCF
jgi:hypothetical protein